MSKQPLYKKIEAEEKLASGKKDIVDQMIKDREKKIEKKRLYVCLPLAGRSAEDIWKLALRMKNVAEMASGEKLEIMNISQNGDIIGSQNGLVGLCEALGALAQCDWFVGLTAYGDNPVEALTASAARSFGVSCAWVHPDQLVL